MGNGCMKASSMEWDGEDWSSLMSNNTKKATKIKRSSKMFDEAHNIQGLLSLGKEQKDKLLGTQKASNSDTSSSCGKVTLKISKKELLELLGGMAENNDQQHTLKKQLGGGACSAEQVLLRLINARNHAVANKHHGPWKPVLDSIPESPKIS